MPKISAKSDWFLLKSEVVCALSNGDTADDLYNFYIVDLENFATASRRYTGDIHNSSVVGLFMTPIGKATKKATRSRHA